MEEARESRLGILYGVGVGPGDPGLVTLRAVEVIGACPTVAFPVHKEGASSRALETVRAHVPAEARLLPLLMPMTRDAAKLEAAHEAAARQITQAAAEGDVAYLSLGDPLFYSTFGYLAARFPGEVRAVSGVAAMSACAAALGEPMSAGDRPTAVVTGADHESIRLALEMGGSLVIMKPRGLSEESLDLLERSGALGRASAGVELGGSDERIIPALDRETAAKLPYFSLVWIKSP
ncbi:MAG: precorrin-2 C(20)-methyltransferase [Pseudomonadota bacterium]